MRKLPPKLPLIIAFLAIHPVLAVIIRSFPFVGTAHAIGCVVAGMVYAAFTKTIRNVAIVVGYIVGSEVLWRMTRVGPLWEFGKYACLAILVIALLRIRWRRNRGIALAYFALLIPSAVMTFLTLPSLQSVREGISSTLAGPLLLAVAVVFFSNVQLTTTQLRTTVLAVIAPTLSIAMLCYLSTNAEVEFAKASNDAVSGGYGANQVSAALGLASMLAVLLTFDRRMTWRVRGALLVIGLALGAQATLTFARGGIALAILGLLAAMFFMLRGSARMRISISLVCLVIALVARFVIQPSLDELTGGELSTRYTDTSVTGRDQFIASEIQMFSEEPVLGMGPGVGNWYRQQHEMRAGASHTEYTRMLGEHGMLGILSLMCFLVLALRGVRGPREMSARGFACALILWASLFFAVYGTRLAAPSFVFGLAFALRMHASTSTELRHA